jgi:tetratricopeptide (TPR) repeat protein
MIYGLHESVDGEAYLTNVYLPWFENYNRRMAAFMEGQTGRSMGALYERMPDSRVAGNKVIGVRTRFPAMSPAGNQMPLGTRPQNYETRMTTVNGLVLVASSDALIAKMIAQVDGLQPAPAQGPMATFALDLGAYLRGIQELMPDTGQTVNIPDDLGNLTMQADMQDGELSTRTHIKVRDLQQMANLLARLSAGKTAERTGAPAAAPTETVAEVQETAEPVPDIRDTAAYWMDRGGLLSAYGNYRGAARSFQKALELAPDRAEGHFQLGVAYGELGRFDAAINAISRAIDRMPANGAYFYGRARVYLLAGDEELAMKDFMEAAFLGDEKARTYLKHAGMDWQ